ncbi:MAG: 2-oxoglutarate dehydrogenase complex dihydrolipoyllysine-residue succinyltransferase [Vicinamibacterales bacterium]
MPSNVVVPQLGESVVEARVGRWRKKPGDAMTFGEPLVELETEKTNLEVSADRTGVLLQIVRAEGEDVLVGDVLATVEDAPAGTGTATSRPAVAEASAPQTAQPREAVAAVGAGETTAGGRGRSTPTARNVAAERAIDPSTLAGTGDAGRVLKRDVEAASAPRAPRSSLPARPTDLGERPTERVRMSKRRLTIARNLVEVQQSAAMLTTFNEVDMSAVMGLRDRRKQAFKERFGVNLGLTSFFVKASIAALRAFPRINAEIQGDEMVLKQYYDIGIAVGAAQGLVVPVLRDADRLTFGEIEQQVRAFAKKADEGTLALDDLRGGSFTITNGGVFGSLLSTPILNPPQVGILGLHKIADRPVAVGGRVEIRPMMYLALTYDHRIVDGLEAVQFLVTVKARIEDPGALLIEA